MTAKLIISILPIGIFTCCLLHGMPAGAETSFELPLKQNMFMQYDTIQNFIYEFEDQNQLWQHKIHQAGQKVRSSPNSREKRFYRLEYIRLRALHVKKNVAWMTKVIRMQDTFLKHIDHAAQRHAAFAQSPQMKGMQNLMHMVVFIESEGRSEKKRSGTENEMVLIQVIQGDLLTYVLATLVSPHPGADPEFRKKIVNLRQSMYHSLFDLKEEFLYLSRRLKEIPNGG